MTNNHSRYSAVASVPNSADFVAQIELVDALLDRQTEKLIALKEEHAAAFAPFESLANKYTLSKGEKKQYAAAEEAIRQVIEKINRTKEREHQLRLARRLLRLAMRVADELQARPPTCGKRPWLASDADVRRVIEGLGDLAEAELLSATRQALRPAKVTRVQLRRAREQAFGPARRGRWRR